MMRTDFWLLKDSSDQLIRQVMPRKLLLLPEKSITLPNIPEELTREATFMSAKANYSLNNFDEALRDFRKVATEVTSIEGRRIKIQGC